MNNITVNNRTIDQSIYVAKNAPGDISYTRPNSPLIFYKIGTDKKIPSIYKATVSKVAVGNNNGWAITLPGASPIIARNLQEAQQIINGLAYYTPNAFYFGIEK